MVQSVWNPSFAYNSWLLACLQLVSSRRLQAHIPCVANARLSHALPIPLPIILGYRNRRSSHILVCRFGAAPRSLPSCRLSVPKKAVHQAVILTRSGLDSSSLILIEILVYQCQSSPTYCRSRVHAPNALIQRLDISYLGSMSLRLTVITNTSLPSAWTGTAGQSILSNDFVSE